MSIWLWIGLAIAAAVVIVIFCIVRHAVISATSLEDFDHKAARNRQSNRRTHYGQYLYRKKDDK